MFHRLSGYQVSTSALRLELEPGPRVCAVTVIPSSSQLELMVGTCRFQLSDGPVLLAASGQCTGATRMPGPAASYVVVQVDRADAQTSA
mmetsp:Transcript_23742/g.47925  ORF Transcript_23742/g.47925 Transcript_23742/m.47925 type:complete len:89 (-) Transcript_23742:18-284(-)